MGRSRHGISLTMIRRRVLLLLGLVGFAAVVLFGRLVSLQVYHNEFYLSKGLDQRLRQIPVDAERGDIFDRNGEILVTNLSAASVYAIPIEVKDKELTARTLSSILKVDYEFVLERVSRRSAAEWIKKRVTEEEANAVLKLNLPGIGVVDNPVRFYPQGNIAPHVMGIVGIDNQGLEGLELFYDEYLKGKPGRLLVETDAAGRHIPDGLSMYERPVPGLGMVLTIDRNLQIIAQREVDRVVAETSAKRGTIIAMEPHTGEILAMASSPSYDLVRYNDYPVENRKNIAVTDMYEPGSTFKIVTAAAGMEEGVAGPGSTFNDPGFIRVSGWDVHCWNRGGHGTINFKQALEVSCNVAFATLALRLGDQRFYRQIRNFGFGAPTGIDFPGESPGMVHQPSPEIPEVTWANVGFGQGITVTPLQLLTAACAIANGGELVQPHLVKELVTPEGKPYWTFVPRPVRRVMSEKNSAYEREMMRGVVESGSGKRAEVKGYYPAGKTGTSQVVEHGAYSAHKTIASFVGFAPWDDPKIAVIVVVFEPGGGGFGGGVAAPVFARIVEKSLSYMGVPQREIKKPGRRDPEDEATEVKVPDLVGWPIESAQARLREAGLKPKLLGTGGITGATTPPAGTSVPSGSTVLLYADIGTSAESPRVLP